MRIIAGAFKGRRLLGPRGSGLRPTSDRLRETLFNVLRDEVEDSAVLDGFAGTGAVGLEALSRGARTVTFVERDLASLRVLRQNVATCGVEDACAIIRGSFFGLSTRHPEIGRFDLVFVDPPYDVDSLEAVVADGGRVLGPSGVLILEHSSRRAAPGPPGDLALERTIAAGDSALTLYRATFSG